MFKTIMQLASEPRATAQRCRNEVELRELFLASLLLILLCTAAFGLVLGSVRDWEQALATGVKLPWVWLGSLIFTLPGFYVFSAFFGEALSLRSAVALMLAAMARGALVLFACLPVVWLASDMLSSQRAYHQVIVLSAAVYGLAALAALGTISRAFRLRLTTIPLFAALAALFLLVSGQTAWSLRPFVGRPAQQAVPWFRAPEGTFLQAVDRSMSSAQGSYESSEAEEWDETNHDDQLLR